MKAAVNQSSVTGLKDSLPKSHWAPIVWQALFCAPGDLAKKNKKLGFEFQRKGVFRPRSSGACGGNEQRNEQSACSREKPSVVRPSQRDSEAVRPGPGAVQSTGTALPSEPIFATSLPGSPSFSLDPAHLRFSSRYEYHLTPSCPKTLPFSSDRKEVKS